MADSLINLIPNISLFHLNVLFILSIALFGGTLGARIFQKAKIPQVVGYIIVGLLLGRSGLNMIDIDMIQTLKPLNYFALGLIGFMIGGELKTNILMKYGKQFLTILLCEGLISFTLVTLFIGFLGTYLLGNAALAWSLAVMLGAIASATAPAATTDVLWEYRSKGPLTTTIFGIVALDDALALILFALSSSVAHKILGDKQESLWQMLLHPTYEIGGAILIGLLCGLTLMTAVQHYTHQKERVLVLLLGMLMFVLGLSMAINTSMILAAMVLGAVVVNKAPQLSKEMFQLLNNFAPPVYVLFFVLIGAKLHLGAITELLLMFVLIYLIGRTSGKMLGSYLGAKLCKAHPSIQTYLPLCLFSQAGVSIGLSIVAAQNLPDPAGQMIVVIITASTFVVQLIGPYCVKMAISKANETHKNITEKDLLELKTKELMDPNYPIIYENTPLQDIISLFSESKYTQFPVANQQQQLTGVINIESIKQSLMLERDPPLMLGYDIKHPYQHQVNVATTLKEAKAYMNTYRLGMLPIVDDDNRICGCFDRRMYQSFISSKLLKLNIDETS